MSGPPAKSKVRPRAKCIVRRTKMQRLEPLATEEYFVRGILVHGVPMLIETVDAILPEIYWKVHSLAALRLKRYLAKTDLPESLDAELTKLELKNEPYYPARKDIWLSGKKANKTEIPAQEAKEKHKYDPPDPGPALWIYDLNTRSHCLDTDRHKTHMKGRNIDIGYYYSNNGLNAGLGLTILSEFRNSKWIYRVAEDGPLQWLHSPKKKVKGVWLHPGKRSQGGYAKKRLLTKQLPDWDVEANHILWWEMANHTDPEKKHVVSSIDTDPKYLEVIIKYVELLSSGKNDSYAQVDEFLGKNTSLMPSTLELIQEKVISPIENEAELDRLLGRLTSKGERRGGILRHSQTHDNHFHYEIHSRYEKRR
jgi:hypothetical protein